MDKDSFFERTELVGFEITDLENFSITPLYPDLKNSIENVEMNLTRISKALNKNFKVYGILKGEQERKRIFKKYGIHDFDLSRIPGHSQTSSHLDYNNYIFDKTLVICKLGKDESTGKLIAQFYRLDKIE